MSSVPATVPTTVLPIWLAVDIPAMKFILEEGFFANLGEQKL